MGDDEKQAEIDRKKAEVRARLEAQAAGKKAKKGFMTPERKKKLRVSDINIIRISPSNCKSNKKYKIETDIEASDKTCTTFEKIRN